MIYFIKRMAFIILFILFTVGCGSQTEVSRSFQFATRAGNPNIPKPKIQNYIEENQEWSGRLISQSLDKGCSYYEISVDESLLDLVVYNEMSQTICFEASVNYTIDEDGLLHATSEGMAITLTLQDDSQGVDVVVEEVVAVVSLYEGAPQYVEPASMPQQRVHDEVELTPENSSSLEEDQFRGVMDEVFWGEAVQKVSLEDYIQTETYEWGPTQIYSDPSDELAVTIEASYGDHCY
jgi:hypothetical protein